MPTNLIEMLFNYIQKTISHFDAKLLILRPDQYLFFFKSFILWCLIYLFIHFCIPIRLEKKKDIYDTKTRFVSIIHASLIFILSVIDVIFYQSDKCGDTNTEFQNKLMMISSSYFLYDLITCLILGCSDNEMVLHHICVIIGYNAGLGYNNSANEMIRALVVSEITCPIMHLRMILKNYKLKHTKLHDILDYVYMILYLLARMGYGIIVEIFTLFCWDNLFLVKVAGTVVWVQSFVFSKRMIRIINHRWSEYKERKEKHVSLFWFSHNKKVEELDYYKNSLKKHAGYIP